MTDIEQQHPPAVPAAEAEAEASTSPTASSAAETIRNAYTEAMADGEDGPKPLSKFNYLNLGAYVSNAVITFGIGVGGWFGLMTNSELSALYQTLITPAGWAFSIWSLIFLSQAVFAAVQLFPAYRSTPQVQDGVHYYYAATCFFQILWTIFFANELMWLSFFAMVGILCSLMALLDSQSSTSSQKTWKEYWLFRFPFQLHLGWIIAATLVNFSLVLVAIEYSASAQIFVAVASLLILLGVSLSVLFVPPKPKFVIPIVLCWAVGGIWFELSNPSQRIQVLFKDVTITRLSIGAGVVCVAILVGVAVRAVLYRMRKEGETKSGDEEGGETPGEVGGDYVNVDKISDGAYA